MVQYCSNKEDSVGSYVYCCYSDPLAETILENSVEQVSQLCGFEVYPTYSYIKVYQGGDKLLRHLDRPSCEISLTVNIDFVGQQWPIYAQYKDETPSKYVLDPGDALIYLGTEVYHWREKLAENSLNAQLMLHFVRKDGIYSEYKYDQRQYLGHLK